MCMLWGCVVSHASVICVTWLIHMLYFLYASAVWRAHWKALGLYGSWCIHTCDMTHLYVVWVMVHSYMWHDAFICCVSHGAFIHVTWIIHMLYESWCIHTCDITHLYVVWVMVHSYVWHDSSICWIFCVLCPLSKRLVQGLWGYQNYD